MAVSQSTPVTIATILFGFIAIGFGIFDLVDPTGGLTFFEFEPPVLASTKAVYDSFIYLIGIRDIFVGIAILATLYTGNRAVAGWIITAFSAVAFGDGVICYQHGKGEWNHWGYAPMLTICGALLMGVADSKQKLN